MSSNVYFTNGTRNEQHLVEDLIIESIGIHGQQMYYIPRQLVSKDDILGEDRLSQFKSAYSITMYFENVDSFDGQGAFIQKFGLMMEQSATLVVARRRWEQLVGRFGDTIIPSRPCEGDLIYFPLTKGLFEIKFVKHQDPFYQLGRLNVFKLQVELFQYSSERLDTGIEEVDAFESLKTFTTDANVSSYGSIIAVDLITGGSGYTTAPTITFSSVKGYGATAEAIVENGVVTEIVVTNGGRDYPQSSMVAVNITGANTTAAAATAVVDIDIDSVESYGDNNKFKDEASDLIFNEDNPFGDL